MDSWTMDGYQVCVCVCAYRIFFSFGGRPSMYCVLGRAGPAKREKIVMTLLIVAVVLTIPQVFFSFPTI
jgi:hypothetical protein